MTTEFSLSVSGEDDPVETTIGFLTRAEVVALAPGESDLSAARWRVKTEPAKGRAFPAPEPESPATLPVRLRSSGSEIFIEHWLDGDHSGRDNVKFWAGAAGYPGAALAQDAIACISALGDNALAAARQDPFSVEAPMSSSFRFDWRRDYIPLDVGFSPNDHSGTGTMVGFPVVELMAAIGLSNARPSQNRRTSSHYRYGVIGRLPILTCS